MQQPRANEAGSAFLITLIALSLMSLLALYVSLNASTGLQISDNYGHLCGAGWLEPCPDADPGSCA
ncbi:MAG: hypothetical protein H6Q07_3356 [Acidobacteria bacterium]|nr:hypothetical protein [Acidobacteriota bacterium]